MAKSSGQFVNGFKAGAKSGGDHPRDLIAPGCHAAADIPVPSDILVYTSAEWNALPPDSRFARTLRQETVWVYERDAAGIESRD